jgi:hypothetical protein
MSPRDPRLFFFPGAHPHKSNTDQAGVMTHNRKFSFHLPHRDTYGRKVLTIAAICAMAASHAAGQVSAASLSGSVTDPSGAALANATVSVLDTDTGASQKTATTPKAHLPLQR